MSRLTKRLLGSVDIVQANSLEEVATAAIRNDGGSLLVSTRQPDGGLRAALLEMPHPFMLALDDPRCALLDMVNAQIDAAAATRAAATACAALTDLAAARHALVLRVDRVGTSPQAAAAAVANHFGLPLTAAELAHAVGDVAPFIVSPGNIGICRSGAKIAACPEVAALALRGYLDHFGGRGWSSISWLGPLFTRGDEPSRSADGVIDLAGEVRALLFGPYIALPSGSWHCRVRLAVSKSASDIRFSIDVVAGPACISLAAATGAPDPHGTCRVTLPFVIDRHTDQPISLRVINLQPAVSGRLALIDVVLNRQTGPIADIPTELSAALGP